MADRKVSQFATIGSLEVEDIDEFMVVDKSSGSSNDGNRRMTMREVRRSMVIGEGALPSISNIKGIARFGGVADLQSTAGTGSAITALLPLDWDGVPITTGLRVLLRPPAMNAGPVTLDIGDGAGARPVMLRGNVPLAGADLNPSRYYTLRLSGTGGVRWEIIAGDVPVARLEDVAGFDPDNAHVAAAAIATRFAGLPVDLWFEARTYTFKATSTFTSPAVRMQGAPGHKLLVTAGISANRAAFEFGTQTLLEPTGTARQPITANLARGAGSCSVSDASFFIRGDWVMIVSGSGASSGEYWYGLPGEDGFDRARKTELLQVERVIGNDVYFAQPTVQSYDCINHAVELRRLDMQGQTFEADGLNWRGPGGGATHGGVHSPSTGPRAINVWGFERVDYRGGTVTNFPGFGMMFYSCVSGAMIGAAFEGWDTADAGNFTADPAFRSIWFTGVLLSGGTDWTVLGCSGRNMRRIVDTDRGPLIPRNMLFANNTADGCEYVWSGHVAEHVAYIGNVGHRCDFGILTRARNTLISGNKVSCKRYGLQAGPIEGDGIDWPLGLANTGTLVVTDNDIEVTDGEYFHSLVSFDRMVLRGNTLWGSASLTRQGVIVEAKAMRNLDICDNRIELPALSTGSCIYIGDGEGDTDGDGILSAGAALEVQDGVTIEGNVLTGGAHGLRFRGVNKGRGAAAADRSRNLALGPNSHFVHSANDVLFEAGAFDGGAVRILPGKSLGARSGPRLWLGSTANWTQQPLVDPAPFQLIDGSLAGFIAQPTNEIGFTASGATLPQGGEYWREVGAMRAKDTVAAPGTFGTLAGVTGSITAGSDVLTVSDASALNVGVYLAVDGAPAGRVVSIAGLSVTLSAPATATATGAPVTYRAPVIV